MLERFLVVQRDPQIMPIINEVVFGFSRHFQCVTTTPHCQRRISTGNETGQLNRHSNPRRNNPKSGLVHVLHHSEASRHCSAPTPPSTAAKWRQLLHRRSGERKKNHGNSFNSFKNTRRPPGTATCGARCVSRLFPWWVWKLVGSCLLPWTLPLPHGGRVWLEESGDPTCFHWNRGAPWLCGGGAESLVPAPLSSLLPSTHNTHGSGVSSYIYTLQLRKGYLSYERIWYNNLQIVQHRMHVEKINHPMANARGIASFGWRKHCMSDGNLHPMDFYSHPVCSNENIRLTLQMGLMCSNHKPLPLNTIKGARLPTSGHVELS